MSTIIHTPTSDISKSLEFYQKLGFTRLPDATLVRFSDGQFVLEVNQDRFARPGLKLVAASWAEAAKKLEKLISVRKIDKGYLFADPSGVWNYLVENADDKPYNPEENPPSVLGNFAGISLETTDMGRSMEIYEILGFSKTMGSPESGWVSLSNQDGISISLMQPLMCPHLFFNPSLTFFNGKNNPAIIEKIRQLQIPITEEISHFNKEGLVDNIIIRDPGGYGFFIFND